jgi:tetrahydromethanopterin S-methyltransferase subunit D
MSGNKKNSQVHKVGWATALSLPNISAVKIEIPMIFSNVIYVFSCGNVGQQKDVALYSQVHKVGWATALSLPNISAVKIEIPMIFSNVIYMFSCGNVGQQKDVARPTRLRVPKRLVNSQ